MAVAVAMGDNQCCGCAMQAVMEDLRRLFGPGTRQELLVFFLDVCQFYPYYKRCPRFSACNLPGASRQAVLLSKTKFKMAYSSRLLKTVIRRLHMQWWAS